MRTTTHFGQETARSGYRRITILAGAMVLPAMLLLSTMASADVLTWDIAPGTVGAGNGTVTGGTGTWNVTDGNWTTNGGATNVAWANTNMDEAIFGGTNGTVTITGTGITANKLTFNAPGYTIEGNVITLSGTTPTIDVAGAMNYITDIYATVAGGEGLNKTGGGMLILRGANTYTGGTTVLNGAVYIGNGGTTGSITGNVDVVGILGFNRSDALTFAGTISGGGYVWQAGSGTTTLTGDNTIGGTYLLDGTLSLGSSGAIGATGPIYFLGGTLKYSGSNTTDYSNRFVAINAGYRIDTNQNVTFASPLIGGASLTKLGGGTLYLTAANTYTGGTTILNGGVYIGNGGTTGTLPAAGGVTNHGTLVFNRSDTYSYDGNISGTGALYQSGSGTTTLTGTNTYTGGTTLAAGTLSLGSAGAIGTTGSILLSGGTLQYSASNATDYSSRFNSASTDYRIDTNSRDVIFASTLTAAASFTKIGGGTIYLTADNTYTGGTTVGNQGVHIGNGGTTGSITGNVSVLLGGTLGLNRSNAMTFAGTITGAGVVQKSGGGTTTLTGTNTYTGGTHLVDGTLSLGSSGAIGATGPIYFLGGTLQYSASNTTDYSGRIEAYADCRIDTNGQDVSFDSPLTAYAGLTKLGGGTIFLTADNTYTGGTSVNSGRLLVNNTSGSGTGTEAVAVHAGGTLGGTGSISGAVIVNSGGHLAPGASIESLDVASLVLSTGSILDFEFGAPGSPGINSDLINITATGGLTLNGGSFVFTNAGGLAVGTYTLIDYVGTLGGAFANLGIPTGPAGFSYSLFNNTSNTFIGLTIAATILQGDYNSNGKIDAADYVLWRKSPNTYGGTPAGYNTWRANFGQPGDSGAGAIANAAVPEPASAWLLIVGTVVATLKQRRIASRVPLSR